MFNKKVLPCQYNPPILIIARTERHCMFSLRCRDRLPPPHALHESDQRVLELTGWGCDWLEMNWLMIDDLEMNLLMVNKNEQTPYKQIPIMFELTSTCRDPFLLDPGTKMGQRVDIKSDKASRHGRSNLTRLLDLHNWFEAPPGCRFQAA